MFHCFGVATKAHDRPFATHTRTKGRSEEGAERTTGDKRGMEGSIISFKGVVPNNQKTSSH